MKININKAKIKDIVFRVLKTFIQTFLATLTIDKVFGITDLDMAKKVAFNILSASFAAGICAVWNLLQEELRIYFAGKGAGTLNFDNFCRAYLGEAIDYDGVAGKQCVDLIKLYLKHCFGILAGSWGNAHAYYDYYNIRPELKANFVRIKNSPKFVPMKGDICVWSKNMNKFGHIAIATGEGDTKTFKSLDMNWGGENAKYICHDYDYFLGVLRPIHREGIDDATLFRVKKAVNVRDGAGTGCSRILFGMFTDYEKEQVLANGGKASDNDFPKGMLVTVYKTVGSWCKISDTKDRWVHKNYLEAVK